MNILSIDQGTSGTKAIVVDETGVVLSLAEIAVHPQYLAGGGVEQDPSALLQSVLAAGRQAVESAGVRIEAVALANQGETVLAWDPATGEPLTQALVWQDGRSQEICDELVGSADLVAARTGLVLDPYFSAPKMAWLRRHLTTAGVVTTTDAWLVHALTGEFAGDVTTASRSLILDIDTVDWDPELLTLFGLQDEPLPRLVSCDEIVGTTTSFGGDIPVTGLIVDQLPPDTAGQMKDLQNYEFLNPDAQSRFQELVDQLKQAMTNSFFKDVEKMVEEMSDGDKQRMKDMVKALNDMLAQKMRGETPDFDGFMDQFGDMFGDNPPQSLDELISQMQSQMSAMQSLMDSLPGDQRQQLQSLMADKLGDAELEAEMSELAQNLDFLNPSRDQSSSYPFRGDEEVDLQAAMNLMSEMQDIDALERGLERAQYTGELDQVDTEALRELLGDEAVDSFDELKQLLEVLEEAGYIRREGDEWQLTPRGTRMIGQNALTEIYRQLKKQGIGNHPLPESGRHGERLDESKPYEFGDPFHLDMRKTIMNAVEREGSGSPVHLSPDDFEIYRSELMTTTTTVLMVDLSWSMALRGSFQAAKKVALALQNLIKAQYPKDSLYIIGFSAYARELKPQELPYVRWDESVLGTNMHHALLLAERLLAKHRVGSRQILMISDGEPTAHLERGRSQFSYPPSPVTIRETLKAVKRVTQQDITINTFMLDRNYYLKEFVNQLAKINGGRVFYTTPDRLGEYILVDYVQHKRKRIAQR
ncbi:MAG: FGGY family carbohydrate kinase [Chloroflexota bacterium]